MKKPDCAPDDLSQDAYTKEMQDRLQLANARYNKYLQDRLQLSEAQHAQALASYLPTLVMLQFAKLACDPKADTTPPDLEAMADDMAQRMVAVFLDQAVLLTGKFATE